MALVKAFRDFAPDLEQLRVKIKLRIIDLMQCVFGKPHKVVIYGRNDTLEITTGEGNMKVYKITYYHEDGTVKVTLAPYPDKELDIMELSHDDMNAIYENLFDNIVNNK